MNSPLLEEPLKLVFGRKSHDGMVRTIAASGPYIGSGSSDETVRIFDHRNNIDIGNLDPHMGYVEDCGFFLTSHFFACGQDGNMKVYTTRDWELINTLRCKKAVNSIAVHPSGKLLLSVDKSNTLTVWNLGTAKRVVQQNMPKPALDIFWSPCGNYYGVMRIHKVLMYDQKGELIGLCKHKKGLCAARFVNEKYVVLGTQDEKILIWNL